MLFIINADKYHLDYFSFLLVIDLSFKIMTLLLKCISFNSSVNSTVQIYYESKDEYYIICH